MRFQGAVVKEQGVTFAVVIVKKSVLDSGSSACSAAQRSFQPFFPGLPIVLMAQDGQGIPGYFGRSDISKFLANIDFRRIPWREYTAA